MSIYERLGVRRVINAQGHHTILGNTTLPETVRRAMDEAAQSFVDMHELLERVGERVAQLTRNDAAYVCNGASCGLFLSALAVMTRGDRGAIRRLPAVDGLPNELIIHRAHRVPPDLPVLLTGARWREVGTAAGTSPEEILAAIGERTAAIVYMPNEDFQTGTLSLSDTLAVGREAGVPVIVDAAAELPPPDNLWYFTRDLGADLAVFSGGKAMCGPPGSGIILGRQDFVEACRLIGPPHGGVGRAMKIAKEEVVGLLAALESFLSLDHLARKRRVLATLDYWAETLGRLPGLHAIRARPATSYQWEWRIRLEVDATVTGLTAAHLRSRLWNGEPRIAVMAPPQGGEIQLTPYTLEPGEELLVAKAVAEILRSSKGE